MGSNSSFPLPKYDQNIPYFLAHTSGDTIKLAMACPDVIKIFSEQFRNHWSHGFREEKDSETKGYTIGLCGIPFADGSTLKEAVEMKLIFQKILCDLHAIGYDLITSCDLGHEMRLAKTCVLFFQKTRIERPTPTMFCLSISHSNALQIIGHDDQAKAMIKQAVIDICGGFKNEKQEYPDCYQIMLSGDPWLGDKIKAGSASVSGRKLLLVIFSRLHASQYRLHAKANLKGTADIMYFIKDNACKLSHSQLCMISLNGHAGLGLINCNTQVAQAMKTSIMEFWPQGMEQEKIIDTDVIELILNGSPWWSWKEEAIQSRVLLVNIMSVLFSHGWCVLTSLDINRCSSDKSVFILRQCPPMNVPHFCISFKAPNNVQFICTPMDMQEKLVCVIRQNWPAGMDVEKDRICQITFNGIPFNPSNENECMMTKVMVCHILFVCHENGWHLITSADISGERRDKKSYSPQNVCDWFFAKNANA